MAQKLVESAVRDLQKTIEDMAERISSMETAIRKHDTTITKQGEIITTQVDIIKQLQSFIEGTSKNTALIPAPNSVTPPTALQRPARQARLNAIAGINSLTGNSAAAKKSSVKSASKLQASLSDVVNVSKTLEVRQCEQVKTTPTTKEMAHTHERESGATTTVTPPATNQQQAENIQDDNWQTVTRKRAVKNQRRILTGSGKADDTLQAIEKRKHIQAWSFRPDTTTDCVKQYLTKIAKCDDYTVEKRNIKTELHAAFVIGFPESLYKKICDPSVWPPRVKLADWWFPRQPRGQRGDRTTERTSRAEPPQRALH